MRAQRIRLTACQVALGGGRAHSTCLPPRKCSGSGWSCAPPSSDSTTVRSSQFSYLGGGGVKGCMVVCV